MNAIVAGLLRVRDAMLSRQAAARGFRRMALPRVIANPGANGADSPPSAEEESVATQAKGDHHRPDWAEMTRAERWDKSGVPWCEEDDEEA